MHTVDLVSAVPMRLVYALSFSALLLLVAGTSSANIIGDEDGRGSLDVIGPSLGLSPEEMAKTANSTGFVICPGGGENGRPKVTSGVMALSTTIVITTAHSLLWKDSSALAEGCFFQNQPLSKKYDRVSFRYGPDDLYLGTTDTRAPSDRDWAVVRLERPLVGATPFRWYEGNIRKHVHGEVILVTAGAVGLSLPSDTPIVQKCTLSWSFHVQARPHSSPALSKSAGSLPGCKRPA